ncbi:FecR family protein [Chitinophaga sp. LS1]|uniref:FecR family protein n=1 Tax=Chitinophaga sp. LS1 TaxID=3051176 RepID=UPI002AAC2A90|nr:FecR domain-containing protein [Chitinophaga sp. LS1]WPV67855.1 FecR domain-containing protein [Chitinophaga sp. LS1]
MSVNPEYIEQLVLDEIAGVITPEDSATLSNLLAQEPEALVIRNDLYAQYGEHPVLENLADTLPVEKVWAGIRKQKRGKTLLRTSIGIAAALLVIVSAYTILLPGIRQPAIVHVTSPKNVALQLPGGQVVNLGNAQQQVQLGNLTLHNQEKTLSYTGSTNQQATLIVPAGKDYSIVLADGTLIQLNAASKLVFPFAFTGNTREVTITGEAYVKVAKDATRPFIVHLPNSTVQVLGTEFNINTYDSGQVKISLVNGAVRLKTQQDSLLLHPGYAVNYTQGDKLQESPFDEEDVLSWRNGLFIFKNASLVSLSRVITRWYGIPVITDNAAVTTRHFSGAMNRNKPIATFLEGLKFTGQFDYYFDKDSVLHMK